MLSLNMLPVLWMDEKYDKYFSFDKKEKKVLIRKDTPAEAVESFKAWKKMNKLSY